MSYAARALPFVLLTVYSSTGPCAVLEGRLFFSAPERALLDDARRRPEKAPPPPEAKIATPEVPVVAPPPPAPITLNGVVRRSDGATTVWINDRAVTNARTVAGVELPPSQPGSAAGRVTVRVTQSGKRVDMGVGQQLDLVNGELRERYRLPPTTAVQAETAESKPVAPRRSGREREILRELLREIDGPAPARDPDAANTAPTVSTPRPE